MRIEKACCILSSIASRSSRFRTIDLGSSLIVMLHFRPLHIHIEKTSSWDRCTKQQLMFFFLTVCRLAAQDRLAVASRSLRYSKIGNTNSVLRNECQVSRRCLWPFWGGIRIVVTWWVPALDKVARRTLASERLHGRLVLYQILCNLKETNHVYHVSPV